MIADLDVIKIYQQVPRIHLGFSDAQMASIQHQIFRGINGLQWKGVHPAGCPRYLALFDEFGVIPQFCFDCYKVLITPRNIMEFFKLLMVFERIALPLDNTRKCMVEEREDCSGAYKGYVYCRSLDEGHEVLEIVRRVISEDISPDVSVTLKRGCSEYEHVYPEFARVDLGAATMLYKNEWQAQEDAFDAYAASRNLKFAIVKPDIEKHEVSVYTDAEILCMQCWLRYAATIGDASYLAIAGMTLPPLPNIRRPPLA